MCAVRCMQFGTAVVRSAYFFLSLKMCNLLNDMDMKWILSISPPSTIVCNKRSCKCSKLERRPRTCTAAFRGVVS